MKLDKLFAVSIAALAGWTAFCIALDLPKETCQGGMTALYAAYYVSVARLRPTR